MNIMVTKELSHVLLSLAKMKQLNDHERGLGIVVRVED